VTSRCIAHMRRFRCPFVAAMTALAVIATWATGLAAVRIAAAAFANPLGASIICHSNGNADPGNPAIPDPDSGSLVCCAICATDSAVLAGGETTFVIRPWQMRDGVYAALASESGVLAPRAVRAGPSQGPPTTGSL
jgi:Protein of unknown function (DUF2946)